MEQFQFIYTSVISQYILAYICPLSLALQDKQCDLVASHEQVQDLLVTLLEVRNDDKVHRQQYKRALDVAAKINVEPSRPCRIFRQKHIANAVPTKQIQLKTISRSTFTILFWIRFCNTSKIDLHLR